MIDYLIDIDTQLLLWLNSMNAEILDPIVKQFSGKAIWIPLYAAIAAIVIKANGWKRGLIIIAAIGVAVACADMACSKLIRPLAERMRPANPDNPISALVHIVDGYRGGRYGFPSCHASNTFALAAITSLMLRYKPYTALIYAWAVLQCYSRIYLGVHYPGDILVGAILGTGIGVGIYYAVKRYAEPKAIKFAAFAPILYVGLATLAAIIVIGLVK